MTIDKPHPPTNLRQARALEERMVISINGMQARITEVKPERGGESVKLTAEVGNVTIVRSFPASHQFVVH